MRQILEVVLNDFYLLGVLNFLIAVIAFFLNVGVFAIVMMVGLWCYIIQRDVDFFYKHDQIMEGRSVKARQRLDSVISFYFIFGIFFPVLIIHYGVYYLATQGNQVFASIIDANWWFVEIMIEHFPLVQAHYDAILTRDILLAKSCALMYSIEIIFIFLVSFTAFFNVNSLKKYPLSFSNRKEQEEKKWIALFVFLSVVALCYWMIISYTQDTKTVLETQHIRRFNAFTDDRHYKFQAIGMAFFGWVTFVVNFLLIRVINFIWKGK